MMHMLMNTICNGLSPEMRADIIIGGRMPDIRQKVIDILCGDCDQYPQVEDQARAIAEIMLIEPQYTNPTEIGLTFNMARNRWTLTYGKWSREFRNGRADLMREEMMSWGADLPDAAIAFISLLK